jgi:Protein of unknown function (DUF1579)
MKKVVMAGFVVALLAGAGVSRAQQGAELPQPQKEHRWLQQLAGEWEAEVSMYMEPGQPPQKSKATESVRTVGGFWTVAEEKGQFMGAPFNAFMTLGYDTDKEKFVATWVDSMASNLWKYEGTLDAAGKVLTLESEGRCPQLGGKLIHVREVLEVKSKNHKVFTSSMLGDDGKWITTVVVDARRKQ